MNPYNYSNASALETSEIDRNIQVGIIFDNAKPICEDDLLRLDQAQSQFLEWGEVGSFARVSTKLARVARELGFIGVAESAHRNAIDAYGGIEDTVHTLYEYRSLACTLGTAEAIKQYGSTKLELLRDEISGLSLSSYCAVDGVIALMQSEFELSGAKRFGQRHYKRAYRYARLSRWVGFHDNINVLGHDTLGGFSEKEETPEKDLVKNWVKFMDRHTPRAYGMSGPEHYDTDPKSIYW